MKLLFNFFMIFLLPVFCMGQDFYDQAQDEVEQRNYTQAEINIIKHLQTHSQDLKAQALLGEIYAYQKAWEKSSKINKQLINADRDNADYHYRYGGTLGLWAKNTSKFQALFLLDDVKHHLKRATELDPKHIDSRWALVQLYMELPGIIGGSRSVAEKYAKQLQEISPVDGMMAFGFIEVYDENFDKAEAYYLKAVQIGKSATTYQKLIDLYQQTEQKEQYLLTLLDAYNQTDRSQFLTQFLEEEIQAFRMTDALKAKLIKRIDASGQQKHSQNINRLRRKIDSF